MLADRTPVGRFLTYIYVPAFHAAPNGVFLLDENVPVLHRVVQAAKPFHVRALDLGDHSELSRDLGKSFLLGDFAIGRIEILPLVVLALSGLVEILERRTDHAGGIRCRDLHHAALQKLEIDFPVPQLVMHRLVEKAGYFLESVLARLFGVHAIAGGSLRLAGKGFQQILLGQAPLQIDFFHSQSRI